MVEVVHGGRLDAAVARFGGDKSKWLDLSTGINPHSYPIPQLAPSVWHDLPDEAARNTTADAFRNAYGVDVTAGLSMAPGTQTHIQLIPQLFKPQAVAIVGFTYQEHGICWQRAGHEVYVTDGLDSAEATARIVVVVSPNNPDGRMFDRQDLISLARRLAAKGGLLVVDESFADVSPNGAVVGEGGRDGMIVLRSLGKFFGLGGVRFGIAVGHETVTHRLEEMLGPWPVSGPALAIAEKAFNDKKWRAKTIKKLTAGREALEEVLISNGHEVVGGTGLFVLSRQGRADDLWEHLGRSRILARKFPGKSEWLRFGLPRGKSGYNRLNKALASFYADV